MKKYLSTFCLLAVATLAAAQGITTPPGGDNQKASVTQWIGLTSVTITYNSPDVHGPSGEDRKGHIWGELVAYGFTDQGFGTSKAAPWRAGANENTTITFSEDVVIEGKALKAGTYGLFLDVEKEGNWTWIFSNNSTSWGSFFYDPKEDALRVAVAPQDAPYTEWLTYGFDDRQLKSAVAYLQWETKRISFKIEVPQTTDLYIAKIREELRSSTGFNYRNWTTAAQFCVQNKVNLEEALTWADYAITAPFVGQENFNTLSTKAQVLMALNRNDEAEALMDKAIKIPGTTVMEVHQYGRSLLAAGKTQKAMDVFKRNRQMHPEDTFTTYVGLARGYTALGDKKNAIKNWETAIKNLPENQKGNLAAYEAELKKLKS
jgi:tetratricopeptide (TPR) repeat protein